MSPLPFSPWLLAVVAAAGLGVLAGRARGRRAVPYDPGATADAEATAERLRGLLHDYMQEREAAEDALAASEARYRTLIARAAYGIYRATPDGRFVDVNPALVAMLGYESEEALRALPMAEVYADPAERARLVDAAREGLPPDDVRTRWRRRDGTPIAVRLSVRPVHDATGRLTALEGIVEDITARARHDELLRRSERMASLGTLLAGVAHEINNPHAAVAGFAQLLLRSPLSEDDRSAVETISHEASRAGKIVRDLLTLAREQERDRREQVRLNDVARHVVGAQRYAMETRGIRAVLELDPADPAVVGDRAQLEQVALNLVVNARQAIEDMIDATDTPARRESAPRVTVRTRAAAGEAVLVVQDDGPGIPAEALPRIFDPFFTTKPEGSGTGLGLSVVDGIVTEHGGTIEAESPPGGGSRFTVRLPRAAPTAADAPAAGVPETAPVPLDVLLVDDEEAILGFLRRYLAGRGHAVVATTSAAEGLRLATETTFDVVICDLRMPGVDGGELVRRLHALPGGEHTRIVIATGEAPTSALRQRASALGASALVEKPYDIEALRRAVERGAEASDARQPPMPDDR